MDGDVEKDTRGLTERERVLLAGSRLLTRHLLSRMDLAKESSVDVMQPARWMAETKLPA